MPAGAWRTRQAGATTDRERCQAGGDGRQQLTNGSLGWLGAGATAGRGGTWGGTREAGRGVEAAARRHRRLHPGVGRRRPVPWQPP